MLVRFIFDELLRLSNPSENILAPLFGICNGTGLEASLSGADKTRMTPAQLDFYFPFFVFFYGFLTILVVETPALARLGQERMSDAWQGLVKRRGLAWFSFFLGGLWSLQNLWFSSL